MNLVKLNGLKNRTIDMDVSKRFVGKNIGDDRVNGEKRLNGGCKLSVCVL